MLFRRLGRIRRVYLKLAKEMSSSVPKDGKRKLIIDTDAGLDDAQAILIGLGRSDVNVVAITIVQGNVSASQVTQNVKRLVKIANINNPPPIYRGCDSPLVFPHKDASYYHGKDGFGDIPDLTEPSRIEVENEHAVLALIRLIKQNPGEISLVCIGPLTNVAMAIRLCPDIGKMLKDCYIMGGNYRGVGNATASAEFNFFNDPEAAHIVISHLKPPQPIWMFCWELSKDKPLTWEQYDDFLSGDSQIVEFFKKAEETGIKYLKGKGSEYLFCDQFAVAAAVDLSLITDSVRAVASVELAGFHTRGQMVIDWWSKDSPNVQLVRDMDLPKTIEIFKSVVINLDKGIF